MAAIGGGVKGIQFNVGDERCSTMSSPPLSDCGLGDACVLPAYDSEPEDGDDNLLSFLPAALLACLPDGWTAVQCGACVCEDAEGARMRWHACVGQTAQALAVCVRGREGARMQAGQYAARGRATGQL